MPGCRDVADGCVLAEVLSRYIPKDVQLHAFERATSRQRKKVNWKLLTKIFKAWSAQFQAAISSERIQILTILVRSLQKFQLPIDSRLEDSVIDADEAAAVKILVILHDFLIDQQERQQDIEVSDAELEPSLHLHPNPFATVAAQHIFHESLPWTAAHMKLPIAPPRQDWQQQQQQWRETPWQYSTFMPDYAAEDLQQSLHNKDPYEQTDDPCQLGPSLEYDKQPRSIDWQPYTDTEFQAAAPRKYWKLGKLGRGPESYTEKVNHAVAARSVFETGALVLSQHMTSWRPFALVINAVRNLPSVESQSQRF